MSSPSCLDLLPDLCTVKIPRGIDVGLVVQILDGTAPADLTGATVRMLVQTAAGAPVTTLESAPGAHLDATHGKVQFALPRTLTGGELVATRGTTTWTYEVRRIAAGGAETLHLVGEIQVVAR